jgi:hypothetical protein
MLTHNVQIPSRPPQVRVIEILKPYGIYPLPRRELLKKGHDNSKKKKRSLVDYDRPHQQAGARLKFFRTLAPSRRRPVNNEIRPM